MIPTFIIPGAPRTKKTHNRVVQAGRFTKVLPSIQFVEWNESAQIHLIWVRRDHFPRPLDVPVNVRALFYRDRDVGDAAGYYQALGDALQEARIIRNDVLIKQWDGSRLLVDKKRPRIEVELTEIPMMFR